MISNTMKLKALSEAPAGWYTSICPVCGGYAWTFDGEPVTCAHCKPDHMTIDTFVL